jgi:hypothetical protein
LRTATLQRFRSTIAQALIALSCSAAMAQPAPQPKTPAPAATPPATTTTPPATAQPATGTATQAPAIAVPAGVVGDRNATLQDRVPPEQLLTLQAGTDSFQARFIADLSGLPRGAVLVLHNSGQHPSWPFTVAALLDDLPLHGWSVLSIELPAPAQDPDPAPSGTVPAPAAAPGAPPAATPAATNTAAAGTPTTATATPANAAQNPASGAAIEARALARVAAALKYLADRREQNVVLLGFGTGATRAAETVRRMVTDPAILKPDPVTTLVLVGPQNKLNGLEQDLPKMLPATELPALDIILSSDPQALADAELRRRAVLHQRKRIYRRLELPPIAAAEKAQQSLMVRRVRAWLQRDPDVDARLLEERALEERSAPGKKDTASAPNK